MMLDNYYYEPTTKEIFDEVKLNTINIWNQYDNTHGYVDGKLSIIKNFDNAPGDLMYMVAMFDITNQIILASMLSEDAKTAIRQRMLAGGSPKQFIVF